MCRLWGWAATFVLITGIGQVQGVVAQLEITSMTIDTPGSKLVVCFTYDGEEVFTKDDIILMCWKVSATPDQKQLGTTNLDDSLEEPSKYCSTHSLPAITPVYSSKTGCEMNIVKNEVPSNISGSAEFTMPEADVFPTCENAYKWIDKSLVGVVCSKVGNFEKALIGETVLTTSKSDNVNYMLYTDAGGDTTLEVSLCTTTNNTALDSVGKLDICIPKIPITTPTEGLELQESELIYSSSGAALYVLSNGETTNNNDLVLITGITITTDTKPGNSERLTVNIPSYTKGTEIDFLVVNYNTAVVSSVSESIKDYELTLTPLTSNTLELSWKHKDSSVNIFTIERDNIGGTATSFTNATVECSGPDVCYGYFVDLTPGESYTCSVSNNGKLNKITGTPATMPPVTKDFSVKQLSLIWNNEVNAAAATVCVEQMNAAMSAKEASYHELIMINSQGQVLKTRQMVQKTENFLCFEGVHLETSTFDISHGKVTLVVVKRSADEHTILARGQTELLFISPEMGRVGQMGHVSWKNPEGYSFIARRGRQPAPLSTSNNGSLVHYFIPKTTGLKDVLVVETEAADVRMTAVIPLIPHVTSVEKQDGSVSRRNPGTHTFATKREPHRNPIATSFTCHNCTDNIITQEVKKNMTSRQDSAITVIGKSSLNSKFNDLPGLTINYMTFPITKSSVRNSVNTLVDVECAEDMADADSLTLTFIILEGGDTSRQYVDVADVAGIYKVPKEVNFPNMDDTAFLPGDVTVEVVGHAKTLPIAYGQAQITLRAPEDTALRVGKQTDGNYEAFRISFSGSEDDTSGAQLDYDSSCDCPSSPCYCLDTVRVTQEPQPFCLKLKNTASTTGETILQCDDQLTASDVDNEAKVTSAKMTHKTSETVDVAVGVNFDGQAELLFYETGDTTLIKPSQTCSGPGSLCTITDQPANSATGDYSILAVTIDGSGDVKESILLAFEDYKTKFTQLTSDAMEVRFSAKTKTLYQVTVTPSSGAYDTTTIECGAEDNNICTVYFISMTAGNYEASVQLRHNGEMNQVATQVIMGTTETKGQKGSVAPINRQNPRDPILTGNLTTLASETNLGSRLPQLTHNSPNKVDARTPFSASFNELPELTVKYMTFPITKTSSGVDVPTLVDVEGADGTNANSLTLAFIVADGASATRQYVDVTDLAASTEVTFAHMNDNALVPGAVTVVVAGHNGEVPVAYGQAQVTLTDPGSKAWRVGKQTDGSHEAFRLTFGKTENDDGAQLDYDSSCDCLTSPCYCLGTARVTQDPQPFCLKLKTTASTTGGIILQCDDQLTASDAVNEAKVTSAKMTHKTSETVDVAVGVNFDGQAELLFYETGDTTLIKPSQTCSGPGSLCTITDQPANSATGDYSILAVTIDGSGDVKESILLAFEDYKTKVTQLTSDAIEVRFSAKTKTLYQVSVTPDGGAYDTTTIECGAEDNNLCTVYFIAMTARNDYEATVQLRTSGELNQVATQFVMETREKISRNATLAFRAKGSERLLDLCVGDQLPSTSGDYILVLIAGLNNTVITKGPLSNENPCFYDVSVDVQPSQHVNIMVLTDEENTRVVMETDVFILDQTSADISVTQVGSKALKATWSNRYLFDLEYEVGLDGVGHTVACKAQQECIEYIHLNSSQGNTNVTIKENNDGTVQVVSVEVSPVTIPELTIASRSIQWDDRLRVCFDRLATADAYELGLEKDDTHLQTNVHAQVDTHATSETCIVSADTVDVGAYVDLWMVVTAFEASGTILASGESTWNTILLSSSRNVRAAIQNTTILASWYLLDDTSTIDNFQVILRSSDGDTVMLASNTQSAYTFTSQSYGTYTVCVKALKVVTTESTVDSEEVCSDIIVFSSNAGPTQNVHETEPKSTAKDSVLLTWQPPQGEENVSGYYVSWSNVNPSSKRSPRRRLPPQSLMRSHEELQQWVSGEGDADFVIVPATETSVEVKDLQEDAKYTFCVSSIVNDVMAQSPACSNTSLADFTPLSPPSLLNPSGGELQWTDNNTGDITYMVEWRSPSEDDHLEVSETSYHLQVAPGKWDVSVRALSADSCSDPNTTTVTIPGVPTSILQVGSKKMTVAWYEEPTPQDNNRYIVDIFQDTQPVDQCTLGCSGDASKGDCSCEFSLETIQPPVVLTVSVHMYSQESYDLNFTMMQISGMRPVATTIRSSSEVDVKWEAVENAKFYQLSLYENESLSVVRWAKQQALPLWVTLTEEDMMGNVFVVQACTDESHCGDATQMTILDQNTSGGSSVVGAVLGGVLGVTILACVIFFFVKRQQVKKKERKALNDQEMAPAEYIYDEWGARRLGQAPVATTLSNTS